MTQARPQQDYKSYPLRLPVELHRAVHEQAVAQDRSFNSQIVAILRAAVPSKQAVMEAFQKTS